MTAEEFIDYVKEARYRIVKLNNIKYPEYDDYINGWDDCIDFLESNIIMISEAS